MAGKTWRKGPTGKILKNPTGQIATGDGCCCGCPQQCCEDFILNLRVRVTLACGASWEGWEFDLPNSIFLPPAEQWEQYGLQWNDPGTRLSFNMRLFCEVTGEYGTNPIVVNDVICRTYYLQIQDAGECSCPVIDELVIGAGPWESGQVRLPTRIVCKDEATGAKFRAEFPAFALGSYPNPGDCACQSITFLVFEP